MMTEERRETENERWTRVIRELERIAVDPTESAARRHKARRALDIAFHPSPQPPAQIAPRTVVGNHRGGHFMYDEIAYEGRNDDQ